MADREPDRLDLDRGPHQRDIEQILAADVGDAKAALSDADDQAARYQPRQALAQWRRADVVALDQVDDAKPRAGARWPARMSCSTSVAARSLKVAASVTGWLGLGSGAGIATLTSGRVWKVRAWTVAFSAMTSPRSTRPVARL